jgi:hypothetical protein
VPARFGRFPYGSPLLPEKTNVGVDDVVDVNSSTFIGPKLGQTPSPRDLGGDLEGHWAWALQSPLKMLIFEYNIDI